MPARGHMLHYCNDLRRNKWVRINSSSRSTHNRSPGRPARAGRTVLGDGRVDLPQAGRVGLGAIRGREPRPRPAGRIPGAQRVLGAEHLADAPVLPRIPRQAKSRTIGWRNKLGEEPRHPRPLQGRPGPRVLHRAAAVPPPVGIIICRGKEKTVVEYVLRTATRPLGVATYTIVPPLPEDYWADLPSPEQIAERLRAWDGFGGGD